MTVVTIAGMHRSGTSMITRLLNLCGVYLGDENDLIPPNPDNSEGYWENRQFTLLNNELLSELGGGWDYPPAVYSGWEKSGKFSDTKAKALEVIRPFSDHKYWGWKDPRNSLTLPFWNELIPSMKVVICVRNPHEVVNSLINRNYFSPALAFNLWLEYNQRILSYTEPKNRIITHYDSYFQDPHSELVRILKFLDINVSEKQLIASINTVSFPLRHNQSTLHDLIAEAPSKVINLYQKMCLEAGAVLQPPVETNIEIQTPFDENFQNNDDREKIVELLSTELTEKREVIIAKQRFINALTVQMAEKEQLVQTLLAEVAEQVAEKEQLRANRDLQIANLEAQLSEVYTSRSWRITAPMRTVGAKLRQMRQHRGASTSDLPDSDISSVSTENEK